MNSLMPLYQNLLADASRWCCASTLRDLETVTERVKHEGLSFLTITLPTFCSDFERSLADGCVSSSAFVGFSKTGALPRFLGGLLTNVFDQKSGRLLDTPCINSIFYIRQICLYAKKVKVQCTPARTRSAFDKYIECEKDVKEASLRFTDEDLSSFEYVSSLLFGLMLNELDLSVALGSHIPKHGPGKTADGVSANRKYYAMSWTRRLEENFFPSGDFFVPNYGFVDDLQSVDFLEPEMEPPVSVVAVPKTLKTPRIIAMEPAHMMYAQQSLMEILVSKLESDQLLGGMIGFTNQETNQKLAQLGSKYGHLATLDLSEASDRVSLRLVSRLLRKHTSLYRAVLSCRSQRASVPGYGVLRLSKFASMGSALCFPIEAMVFLTVVFLGIQKALNRPLVTADLKKIRRSVRVYGDDIIVPVAYAPSVVESLGTYGLKVNVAKSFWTGKFRESCGGEYFDGVSVKPIRLTNLPPSHRRQAREVISFVSQRNQLYEAGCWSTVRYIDNFMERLAPFPVVGRASQAIGRISFLSQFDIGKQCPILHKPLVKALVGVSKRPSSPLGGFGALMKFFLRRLEFTPGMEHFGPIVDDDHLRFAGRPRSVDTRLRWTSPV